MIMTNEEFDTFADITNNIIMKPEYPSEEDYFSYMETTSFNDIDYKFLMWLEANLEEPINDEQKRIKKHLHNFLIENVKIGEE